MSSNYLHYLMKKEISLRLELYMFVLNIPVAIYITLFSILGG